MPENITSPPDDSHRDEKLEVVIADYIRDCEIGGAPDRRVILERHPELADELRQFFGQRDRINQMAEPIRGFGDARSQAVGPGHQVSYVGNYELLGEIARGGMGVVYKARQTTLGRIVAVKMIITGRLATEQDVQRFQIEAKAAAGLQHPNIVSIHEVGQHEGWHYFSMDYVEGRNLSVILHQDLIPPKRAATYVKQVADAIHYAHQEGILHRDLKPSNILIDTQDQIRITDFGLALRIEGGSELTRTGQIMGTPGYMPPEQAQGIRSLIGPSSDVYALGAVLYECLTGRAPFRAGSVVETIQQVIHVEAPSPRLLNPAIPRDLETICLKCLEKEPHKRYGTARLLAEDLSRFLRREPIQARPISRPARAWRWCRRNSAVASLMATVAICLIAGTGVSSYFAVVAGHRAQAEAFYRKRADDKSVEALNAKSIAEKQKQLATEKAAEAVQRKTEAEANATLADQHRIEAEKQGRVANTERDHARKSELFARRMLYASQINLAHQAWQMGHVTRVLDLLESQRPASDQEDLRTFEWYYLWRLCHSAHRNTLLGHTGGVVALAVSPDGTKLASGSSDSTVMIWDLSSGQELIALKGHRGWVFCAVFSPDGKTLATGDGASQVRLWDVATWQYRTITSGCGQIRSLAFTPDGQTLAAGTSVSLTDDGGIVRLWSTPDSKEIATLKCDAACVISVAISADGTKLASSSAWGEPNKTRLWDLNAKPPQSIHEWEGASSVTFSPDGKTLAMSAVSWIAGQVRIMDVATGNQIAVYQAPATTIAPVAFSPDGKILALGCQDRTVRLWESATGRTWTMSHLHDVTAVTFTPDGETVVSASHDKTIKLWSVRQKSDELTIHGHQAGKGGIAYSPDGKILAYAAVGQTIRLCDPATGETQATLHGNGDALSWVNFSNDSQRLAAGAPYASMKVWNITTRQELATINIPQPGAYSLALSPDGKTLMDSAATVGEVQFWDVASQLMRKTFRPLARGDYGAVAYSPDGKYVVTADKTGWVDIWDAETLVRKLRCDATKGNWIWALAFSPDGKVLVTGGEYGFLWTWDTTTGKLLATFRGHTAKITDVAFFPDGKTIASACDDGTVKLWDAPTGQERLTLLGHSDRVVSVAVAPDGKTLATGSNDGTMRLWRASQDQDGLN